MTNTQTFRFWVTCPQGVTGLLRQEIEGICAVKTGDWHKGVTFEGPLIDAYRVCLWSRLANRVFLALDETSDVSFVALERMVTSVDWDQHVRPTGSLKVNFSGYLPEIRDTRFGAQKVKDWVVDQFRTRHGTRPDVAQDPDLIIYAQVAKKKMFLGIELTGDSLHRRGYRQSTGPAPIKENLAAALLCAADWPAMAREKQSFLDLMCGSGTLVIEAAMIAADYAPGLGRARFGFEGWLQHAHEDWQTVQHDARARRLVGIEQMPPILGYDSDAGVIAQANETLEKLGLAEQVRCYYKDLDDWTLPTHWPLKPGLWLSNPPYGERLGDKPTLLKTYRRIGEIARGELEGWSMAMLTSEDILAREIGLRPTQKRTFYNGAIETTLYRYQATPADQPRESTLSAGASEQALAFKNRVEKNLKQLKKWRAKEGIEAYRVYDADLPDFAIAVDHYGDWLHVQEYAAPKSVPEHKAQQRLLTAVDLLSQIFTIPVAQIAVKRREKQKGTKQYEKNAPSGQFFDVTEYGVKLRVNLLDYLDTGLFLDHRNTRQWVQKNAQGQRVLNLFCYTGSFSSHALLGGAIKTVSVDLSKTYLKWARDNLEMNGGKEGPNHQFVHADCLTWLKDCKDAFDLIILDPPTFSNSARMTDTLDVQRDHESMINDAMQLLTAEGVLVFSNNARKFVLAEELKARFLIKDVTLRSVPNDFKRGLPHQCFEIRHRFA
ncbi:MAG: bifunctional 23S rRNA (guanine(2069)-N(7))-methyltransferase RlmK/23S rRNA (guanine(2445)-N(2))-methyltransferase RlmL [Reinekea forsetii]|nr:bifunctional 23S rRNA (guanine(2069)-N(7))-methyltransferase RlmK/23S rRNA (guanine(2445)-N(2))-methyltransferase RlmL [Reinekea forsetii]